MLKLKKKIASIIAIILLSIIIIVSLTVYTFLYGGGLIYFGVSYDTISDFMLFLIASIIVGFVLETIINNIPQVLFDLKVIDKKRKVSIKIILNFSVSISTLSLVDYFMNGISIPFLTIILFSAFITAVSLFINNDGNEKIDNSNNINSALRIEVEQLLENNNMIDTIKIIRNNHPDLSMSEVKRIVQTIRQEDTLK